MLGITEAGKVVLDVAEPEPAPACEPEPGTEVKTYSAPAPAGYAALTDTERAEYLRRVVVRNRWLPGSEAIYDADTGVVRFRAVVAVAASPKGDVPPVVAAPVQTSASTQLEMPGYPGVPLLEPSSEPFSPSAQFVAKWGTRFAAPGVSCVVLRFDSELRTQGCPAFWKMVADWNERWGADIADPDGAYLPVLVPESNVTGFLLERYEDAKKARRARSTANLTRDPDAHRRGGIAARRAQQERTACLTALRKPATRKDAHGRQVENPGHVDLVELLESMAAGRRVHLPEHQLGYIDAHRTCRDVPLVDALRAALGPRGGEDKGALGDLAYRAVVRLLRGSKPQTKPLLLRDCLTERRLRLMREVLSDEVVVPGEHWPYDVATGDDDMAARLTWGTPYEHPKTGSTRIDPLALGFPKLAEIKGDDVRSGATSRRHLPPKWAASLDAHPAAWWLARLDGRDGDTALGWDVAMLAAVLGTLDQWKAATPELIARRTGYPRLAHINHPLYRALFAAGLLVVGWRSTVADGEPDSVASRWHSATPLRIAKVRRNEPVVRALRFALGRRWSQVYPLGEPTLQQGEAAWWHNVLALELVTRWEDAGTCVAIPPDGARNARWLRYAHGVRTPRGIPDALLVTRTGGLVALEVTKTARRDISEKMADYDGPSITELEREYPTVLFAAATEGELARLRRTVSEGSGNTMKPTRYVVANATDIDPLTLSVERTTRTVERFDTRIEEKIDVATGWAPDELVPANAPTAQAPAWLLAHVAENTAMHVRWRNAKAA